MIAYKTLFPGMVLLVSCLFTKANSLHDFNSFYDRQLTDTAINQSIDITHQSLHLNTDPRKRYISGYVETTFKAIQELTHSIKIDLHSDLIIDSIINHSGLPLNFKRSDDYTTLIHLNDTLVAEESTSISIFYQGVPPEDGFGSFVQSTHGTESIIWTLSEPYGARNWWPCGQNLYDKIDSLDLWINVPADYRVAGNGLLLSETKSENNEVIFHWRHRYPIATYLVAFAVTNYKVHKFEIPLKNGPLPIVNYLYPEDYERHSNRIESILPEMMQLFEELFIPYPFDREKYGHAQFGFSGGMEHQTMSFMINFGYELTAHELAHQWFGDYVTCGSWQDIWLNEGFAKYLTGLTYEKILQNGTWENYLTATIWNVTSQPGGSVMVSDTTDVNRIFSSRLSYNKGSMVLHMLRWILGDNDFFEGIRQYLLDDATQYAFVRTRHLVNHLEDVSGVELDEFFEDWYEGKGYPSYHLQWTPSKTGVSLQVNQTTSDPSVTFFELPLEVGLYGFEKDTLIRLELQQNDQNFDIPLSWTVDSISIDPRNWIISRGNTTEVITKTKEKLNGATYRIYPNPAKSEITIENEGRDIIHRIYLYSVTGQLISTYTDTIIPGTSGKINLNPQSPGVYFMRILTNSGLFTNHKIIVH